MSISNYGELKTAIADWSVRSGFTSFLPDFVRMAEDICNYGEGDRSDQGFIAPLRCLQMETTVSLTVTDGAADLPDDFLEVRKVKATSPARKMDYATPEWFDESYPTGDTFDFQFYTVDGMSLIAGQDVSLTYYAKIPTLVGGADGDTNWLLTASPFAYLWGTLYALSIFNKDGEKAAGYRSLFLASTGGFRGTTAFSRVGSAPQMRAASTAF